MITTTILGSNCPRTLFYVGVKYKTEVETSSLEMSEPIENNLGVG